ncbi:MAG: crossover junction endodeoxyribonuclease RuvC [Oscillospiraceae bacterium]|jgi:crossover junction endodeoxyribonuclease RuvC|nr:crossover junction endodeoxyribonuclease RuvC [Oscillospiraceae bacterium]
MRIFGIDPGLAILGWGVIDAVNGAFSCVDYGTIVTTPDMPLPERLLDIHEGLKHLFAEYQPEAIVFEELFFNRNVTTAFTVGAARGCALCAAASYAAAKRMLYEYTPLQVKQAITGFGRSDKDQVQYMVRILLRLTEIPKPDDAADALAVAITHANCAGQQEQFLIS